MKNEENKRISKEKLPKQRCKTRIGIARFCMKLVHSRIRNGAGNKEFTFKAKNNDKFVKRIKPKKLIVDIDEKERTVNQKIIAFAEVEEYSIDDMMTLAKNYMNLGTANCDGQAMVAFCYLVMKGVKYVNLVQDFKASHTFVVIGKLEKTTKKVLIVDPWLNMCDEFAVTIGIMDKKMLPDKDIADIKKGSPNCYFIFEAKDYGECYFTAVDVTANYEKNYTFHLEEWAKINSPMSQEAAKKLVAQIKAYSGVESTTHPGSGGTNITYGEELEKQTPVTMAMHGDPHLVRELDEFRLSI